MPKRLDRSVSASAGICLSAPAANQMPALALTDLSNLFGMVKFYKAARSAGIKPIIGCDVLVAGVEPGRPAHRALLLCQSREGYLRLCDWLTRAYAHPPERGSICLQTTWFS